MSTNMSMNAFQCPRCDKYTRHVQISFREFSHLCHKWGAGHHLFAAVCDITGFSQVVVNGIAGKRYYKCCECGEPSVRNLDGTEWKS